MSYHDRSESRDQYLRYMIGNFVISIQTNLLLYSVNKNMKKKSVLIQYKSVVASQMYFGQLSVINKSYTGPFLPNFGLKLKKLV